MSKVVTYMDGGLFNEPPAPQRKRWLTKKRVILGLALLAALIATGVGIAAWLISANGSAGGKVGTLSAPTVTATTTGATAVMPGDKFGLVIHVVNPNTGALKLTGVTILSGTADSFGVGQAVCPSSNLWLNGQSFNASGQTGPITFAAPITVPAGASDVSIPPTAWQTTQGFSLNPNADNGCQGTTLTISGLQFDFSS